MTYPEDWDYRRRRVYERDDFTCRNCGRSGGPYGDHELHCHHIVPKARGGTHRPDNLATLCAACHKAVHSRYRTAPTAGQADAGSGWLVRLRSAWRSYKEYRGVFRRVRRLF